MLRLDDSLLEVDIGEGIELIHHDLDIVASDAVGECCHSLALVGAGDGVKLSAADVTLSVVEAGGNHVHATGIATDDDLVGELLRAEVEMEDRSIFVDNQLGVGYSILSHNYNVFLELSFCEFFLVTSSEGLVRGFAIFSRMEVSAWMLRIW